MPDIFDGYLPFVLAGASLTIEVAVASLLLAVLLGLGAAAARLYGPPPARWIAGLYTTVIRGIPDIVLMMLIFFGGQVWLNAIADRLGWRYIDLNPFVAGVLTIGFIFGAYMGETFRGAIMAVPKGQIEAGHAYGMSPWQVFRLITLPAMTRHAMPGFFNNWLVLVKTTALVSLIGLQDMVFKAGVAANSLRKPFTFYLLVAVLFLLITILSDLIFRWLQRRYAWAGP